MQLHISRLPCMVKAAWRQMLCYAQGGIENVAEYWMARILDGCCTFCPCAKPRARKPDAKSLMDPLSSLQAPHSCVRTLRLSISAMPLASGDTSKRG